MLNFANFIFHRRFVVFWCKLSLILSFQFFFLKINWSTWCSTVPLEVSHGRKTLNLVYLYFLQSNTFCFFNTLFQRHNLILFVRPFFQFLSDRCFYPLIYFHIILKSDVILCPSAKEDLPEKQKLWIYQLVLLWLFYQHDGCSLCYLSA